MKMPALLITMALVGAVFGTTAAAETSSGDLQTASQDFLSAFSRARPGLDQDLFLSRDRTGFSNGCGCSSNGFYQRYAQFLANLFGSRDFDPYRIRGGNGQPRF